MITRQKLMVNHTIVARKAWGRNLSSDCQILTACGLKMEEVPGDGACLFHAFGDQLLRNSAPWRLISHVTPDFLE